MDNVAIPVNWEAVRMLALAVGVREAARRMDMSEETVKKRCTREGWLASPEARAVNKMAVAQRSGLTVSGSPHLSPSNVFRAELQALGEKSRLSIARGIARAGEHVETLSGEQVLGESANIKNVAQTADLVHGWKDAAPQVKIRLDVLGSSSEPVIDIDVTNASSWDADEYDLDSY